MESFRTEEEQVEALRRWWQENGRSTVVTVVLALGIFFGWQGWQEYRQQQAEGASDLYQEMLRSLSAEDGAAMELAARLKSDFGGTTYAQFAALHRAAFAVKETDLAAAESELRWVLGRADKNSDVAQVARLRLARVLAAAGDTDGALAILAAGTGQAYQAANAVAQGDILLAAGRADGARTAYSSAQALLATGQVGVNLPSLQTKLDSLSPVPPRQLDAAAEEGAPRDAVAAPPRVEDGPGEAAGTSVQEGEP